MIVLSAVSLHREVTGQKLKRQETVEVVVALNAATLSMTATSKYNPFKFACSVCRIAHLYTYSAVFCIQNLHTASRNEQEESSGRRAVLGERYVLQEQRLVTATSTTTSPRL